VGFGLIFYRSMYYGGRAFSKSCFLFLSEEDPEQHPPPFFTVLFVPVSGLLAVMDPDQRLSVQYCASGMVGTGSTLRTMDFPTEGVLSTIPLTRRLP
jgi:hypothetical protein